MKRILSLCLSIAFIFALFTACGEKESERSYEKIVHECRASRIPYLALEEPKNLYTFPPVTCYDDVVLYAKQYYYMTYGEINNNPYTVMYDEEEHCWYYSSSVLVFEGLANVMGQKIITPVDDYWYEFVITDDGNVIFANMHVLSLSSDTLFTYYEPLEEKLSYEGIEFDLSNKFSFSYDDIKDFESLDMFIEKLEPVSSAEDVIERANYLRNRSYKGAGLNPYSVCYDEENDCWLYYEMVGLWETPIMHFVIDSDGQLLLFTFYIPKLS